MKGTKYGSVTLFVLGVTAGLAAAQQTQPAADQNQPAAQATPPPAAAAPAAPSTAPAPSAKFDPSKSDEKAIAIVDQVIAAMGGTDRWDKTRFIKFTWAVKKGDARSNVRTHYWDKSLQRSRMEGPSSDTKMVVALVNHVTKEGQATKDGQLLFDADAKKYVDIAYKTLINDSYWLFMPFKLKDPGVRLRYEGELPAGPVTYDKILVSFDDGVGLTSKDKYWLYVNRDTKMIERWSYILTGQSANTTPAAWEWTDWTTVGGLKLAMRKTQPGGEVDIVLEDVQMYDTLPETVFTSTSPVDASALQQAAATP
jgi:hypothetical protein